MKQLKKRLFIVMVTAFAAVSSQAQYYWVGTNTTAVNDLSTPGDDVSLYQEANWDVDGTYPTFNGGAFNAPVAGSVDPNVIVGDNLVIRHGIPGGVFTASGAGGLGANLLLGTRSLTISGSSTLHIASGLGASPQWNGIRGDLITLSQTPVTISDTAIMRTAFIEYVSLSINDNATVRLASRLTDNSPNGDNSIPIQNSLLNFANWVPGMTASVEILDRDVSTVTAAWLSSFLVNGQPAVDGVNIALTPFGAGDIHTLIMPVPEPTTAVLFGLAFAAAAVFRRSARRL